ncbi:MAG TPA: ATP-binding protein [Opitutaceae bacterium]|nr:ATP-binding protein [Opitutaceae bacterium]
MSEPFLTSHFKDDPLPARAAAWPSAQRSHAGAARNAWSGVPAATARTTPPECAQFVLRMDDTIVSHKLSGTPHWFFQRVDLVGQSLRSLLCATRPDWNAHLPERISESDTPIFLPEATPGVAGVVLALRRLRHENLLFVTLAPELAPEEQLRETGLGDLTPDSASFTKLFLRLRSVESRLEHYLAHLPGVAFHQRADLSFVFVGAGCESLLGVDGSVLTRDSQSLLRLIHPGDERSYYQELDRNAKATKPFSLVYRVVNPQTHACLYVLDVRSPVRSASGLLLGYEGVWLDITRQKIAEHELTTRAWKENLSALTSGLLDDFSNVMTGIISLSELYHSTLAENHPLRDGLSLIQENAGNAQRLVGRIIELSREPSGDRTYGNLAKIIRDQVDLLKIILPRGAHITPPLSAGDWPVCIDETAFRQVLVNLTTNSRDAMRATPGEIRILLRRIGPGDTPLVDTVPRLISPTVPMIEMVFADNGAGIAPAHLARIFDPFFSTKTGNRGAGLGLYNARLFAEAHGGQIAVRSMTGRSTEIVLLLPLADLSVLAGTTTPLPVASGKRVRTLLLDVDGHEEAPLTDALRQRLWDVRGVSTPEHARKILRQEGVRLDVLLVRQSKHPNQERMFFAEIRRDHPGLPIVLLASTARIEDVPTALRTQVDLVLSPGIRDADAVDSLVKLLRLT